MSNGLVRLLAAAMALGSVVTVVPALAECFEMPVTASSKEKPSTVAEAPKPEAPGS
jgi:hypothetical protein